ncbi:biotin--[acetyl-CoA-carboxylase] ligase [Nesterenkonia marinintestina]|uniref:biotin--[acetyl-CoA-carboxylase] ligase n=1 Tax=Nesterenkonia marinintestina TaxID=2979865 RepID=UPI0021C1A6F0|nr:biotin--[acetyl-CoA-carboxylase] ligase [Nesterenkonia sp. GX14115]
MTEDLGPAERPRRLDEARLRCSLVDGGPFSRVERLDSVDSTNLFLQRAGADPDAFAREWPHLSVLTAEEQTAGRGRVDRTWTSPAGTALSTSVVLRPDWDPDHLRWASLLAALSLAEVLDEEYGIPARVKWPNDVHVADRKISGILALAVPGAAGRFAVVLGMGVNALLEQDRLPTETSTSVLLELRRLGSAGPEDLRTELLIGVLGRLAEHLGEVDRLSASASGTPLPRTALGRRLLAMMDTVGRRVRVELPDGRARRGDAVGLGDDGAIIVEVAEERDRADGAWTRVDPVRQSFSAVDVVHLRPES